MRIVRNNEEKGNVFDKHFRELRNSEEKPSADLWDRIEYKLDEDRKRVKHDHWYYAALLLLIPLTVVNLYLSYDLKGVYSSLLKKGTAEQEQVISTNNSQSENNPSSSYLYPQLYPSAYSSKDRTGSESIPTPLLSQHNIAGTQTGFHHTNTSAQDKDGNSQAQLVQSITARHPEKETTVEITGGSNWDDNTELVTSNELIPAERLMLETTVTPQDVKFVQAKNFHEKRQSAIKGFHVGVEGGVNNSMLLIKESTLEPIISNNIHRKADIAGYYGVSMGYDFSSKFGMESELIFSSKQGQKYSELRYGKIHIDGDIDLEYLQVPLLFKYKMSKMGGKALNPRVVNLIAGLQYSRLKSASVQLNDLELQNTTEPFNRDELGLILGVEYDLFVSPNYFFTFGTRASISTDVRAFPFFAPQASQTYNVLFGANVSFHYLMKRRDK